MAERITKAEQLEVGLRFYNQGSGLEGFPCRITVLAGDAVHYRLGQDGTGKRYWAFLSAFLAERHSVLRTGDPAEPPVRH